jgi:hypothetical protein
MQDQKLMDYFKFDDADLQANRNGQLTEKQKGRLINEDKGYRTLRILGGGCLILIALIGLGGAIATGIATSDWGFRIGFGLGFGCIWPVIWGGMGYFVLRGAFAKFQVQLKKAMGAVNIIKAEKTSTDTDMATGMSHTSHYFVYELHIGGKSFDVESNLADIMMQGDTYAVYFTEGSENDILSAELISKAK